MEKVLVFGITENPGGIESVILNYYRHIDRTKIQFDFLCNTEKVAYENEIKTLGGEVFRIAMRSKNRKKYYHDLEEFFSKYANRYDAIWVNVCSLANIDYLRYAKKYGIKKRIIHSHSSQNMDSFFRGLLHKINKLFLPKFATDFWSCSNEASKWFYNKKIIQNPNYHIINNSIDINKFKFNKLKQIKLKQEFHLQNQFVVGNIGRLHFEKNQMFLLDIFSKIKKMRNNSILLLVGDGEDAQKLKEKSKQLEIDDSVKFLGIRDDIPDLLHLMDVFVFPSLFEGVPLALIEAQAASLPVFTSKDCVSSDVKMTDFLSFISLEDSAEKWAERICSLDYNRETLDVSGIGKYGYDINLEVKKLEMYFEEDI